MVFCSVYMYIQPVFWKTQFSQEIWRFRAVLYYSIVYTKYILSCELWTMSTYSLIHCTEKILQVCTEIHHVCTGIYATKQNSNMCMMSDSEPGTSGILSSPPYHYATRVNIVVISVVRTRYLYCQCAGHSRRAVPFGWWRTRIPQRPLRLLLPCHTVPVIQADHWHWTLLATVTAMHYIRVVLVTRVKTAQQWEHARARADMHAQGIKTRFGAIANQNKIVPVGRILN